MRIKRPVRRWQSLHASASGVLSCLPLALLLAAPSLAVAQSTYSHTSTYRERLFEWRRSLPPEGDPSCPCLSAPPEIIPASWDRRYGVGCDIHDAKFNTVGCDDASMRDECDGSVTPLPQKCGGGTAHYPAGATHAWCTTPWCYVDNANCDLVTSMGGIVPYTFSYAACGALDTWSSIGRLPGKVLKVPLPRATSPCPTQFL